MPVCAFKHRLKRLEPLARAAFSRLTRQAWATWLAAFVWLWRLPARRGRAANAACGSSGDGTIATEGVRRRKRRWYARCGQRGRNVRRGSWTASRAGRRLWATIFACASAFNAAQFTTGGRALISRSGAGGHHAAAAAAIPARPERGILRRRNIALQQRRHSVSRRSTMSGVAAAQAAVTARCERRGASLFLALTSLCRRGRRRTFSSRG